MLEFFDFLGAKYRRQNTFHSRYLEATDNLLHKELDLDQTAITFMSECLFHDDPVNREAWLIWAELESLMRDREETDIGDGFVAVPFQQLKLIRDVRHSWAEQLRIKFAAMEAMGEFVIWRCLIYKEQKVNKVKLASDFARNGIRHFRNKEKNPVLPGLASFNNALSLMSKVPDRCAAIRLLISNNNGSVEGFKGKHLVEASQQFRSLLAEILNNPSKHAKKTAERIDDIDSWYQLKPYMQDIIKNGSPEFDLESALKKSWQANALALYGLNPKKVDEFIRKHYTT